MRTPRLDRDRQQWIFDYLVKETGRVFHWDADGRNFPASVKSHAQISKHVGRIAQRMERVAAEEEAAGHRMTAFELYYRASTQFAAAQHPVLETNDEKRYLHGRCLANYAKVIELAPYPIERFEIPFEGAELQCNFHMLKGRPKAPTVIFIPGCDMTKEIYPDPQVNHALDRGMHLLSMDGPGQGTSNLRGTKLTADNYERAVIAIAKWLQGRKEVEPEKITVFSQSMGSHWGLGVAAMGDPIIKANVGVWASYLDKYYILDTFSPRYKQLFGYLTGAKSEEELDKIVSQMTVEGKEEGITAPTLLTTGEYDARSPVELVYKFWERIKAPKELWVYEDTYHQTTLFPAMGQRMDCYSMGMDWIVDALAGRFKPGHARKMYLRTGGGGPHGTQGEDQDSMHWWVK
jgi:pimeloyl-ACP methyl ester carboxylesterase